MNENMIKFFSDWLYYFIINNEKNVYQLNDGSDRR